MTESKICSKYIYSLSQTVFRKFPQVEPLASSGSNRMWPLVFLLCFIQGFGVQGVRWVILIVTSDIPDAGTNSGIFITLHGSRGSSSEIKLGNALSNFERNRKEEFSVTTDDIGEVCSVTIRSDGYHSSPDWHLRERL
ncbi:uncharacterized protein LOC112567660 isoform X2 [Pomacea canaliculata]|uniref:uncharacterized protein LOC112567660 isoform X2 n=1 Tax=Pomacea canaliculata TaxID=400727 RepID=UPI000D72EA0F|nr:uncharacterized protein LOC112567660 isoform X2 [Pomacea canaliculata]